MILTRFLSLREATLGDAAFTRELRNSDPRAMLSPIEGTVADQRKYILAAKEREGETFWIIGAREGSKPLGMMRWTEQRSPDRMNWQSLLLSPDAPRAIGIDSMVVSYVYAMRVAQKPLLGPWCVPHGNVQMQRIHERMGFAKVVDSDKEFLWYAVTREWFEDAYPKWAARGYGKIR